MVETMVQMVEIEAEMVEVKISNGFNINLEFVLTNNQVCNLLY